MDDDLLTIKEVVRQIVSALARNDFELIESLTSGKYLSSQELAQLVPSARNEGYNIVQPSTLVLNSLKIYKVGLETGRKYITTFYFQNLLRPVPDLGLQFYFDFLPSGKCIVTIEGLHSWFGEIRQTVRQMVQLLVAKDYLSVERMTSGKYMKASDIALEITNFGETLIMPSDDVFEAIDVGKQGETTKERYMVDFDLWTEESGHSDVSAQIRFEVDDQKLSVLLEGIHVL